MFDLDGTLLQSEKLKAQAYAVAVQRLLELPNPDQRAIEAYRQVVGASREETARHVMTVLNLEGKLRLLLAQYRVSESWQVLSAIREDIFAGMTADPRILRENAWPYTVEL
ncbi:MAG: HAD hydrolase-like protein [Chloroflexi bacterium]|nr:HAD hydrolase-like protein [Chloroflexota bacterium]